MAEIHRSVRRKALRSRMTARRDPDPLAHLATMTERIKPTASPLM